MKCSIYANWPSLLFLSLNREIFITTRSMLNANIWEFKIPHVVIQSSFKWLKKYLNKSIARWPWRNFQINNNDWSKLQTVKRLISAYMFFKHIVNLPWLVINELFPYLTWGEIWQRRCTRGHTYWPQSYLIE